MSGCLLVVSTPIGNLEDITLRALRVLREADLIAAEDTRRTARLLQHYSISTPATSLHEHNERRKLPLLLARIEGGARVALVTDAGTPGVSDPGARLVSAALERKIRVEPIPGPSAVVAALSVSGFSADSFVFLGFPPVRSRDRKDWFSRLPAERRTIVLFEAPHRIKATLGELAIVLGDRPICVCRELTKSHEETVRRPRISDLDSDVLPRGEFTLVISPSCAAEQAPSAAPTDELVAAEFGRTTELLAGSRRAVVTCVARKFNISAREVYQAIERSKTARADDR